MGFQKNFSLKSGKSLNCNHAWEVDPVCDEKEGRVTGIFYWYKFSRV